LARISGTRIIGSMASPFFFYLTLLIFLHLPIFPNNLPSRVDVPHVASPWRDDEPGDLLGLRWSQQPMHRVGHEHVGVQNATAFFEGFAQPVRVGQGVIFTEETGIAVVATLDTV
jgi:hypothetical protein